MATAVRYAVLLAIGSLLQVGPAEAQYNRYASIALSKNGTQYGFSTNHDSLNAAEWAALDQCARHASDCEIFKSVENGCIGLAIARNGAAAWSITFGSPALRQAESLAECRRQGGDVCDYIGDICSDARR